jgi:hypothetical protein
VVGALVDAAAGATGRVPAAVSAHLHAPVDPGSTTVTTTTSSAGRVVTSATAVLRQGRPRATASVLLVASDEGARHWRAGRRDVTELPAPEEVDQLSGFEEGMPIARHLDIRPLHGSRPFGGGDDQAGRSSAISPRMRVSISSRIGRTDSTPLPAGSSRSQSR